MGIGEWLSQNWFNLFTAVGIIGSLWCSIIAIRKQTKAMEAEAKARKVANQIALTVNYCGRNNLPSSCRI